MAAVREDGLVARRYGHLPKVSDSVIDLDEGHQASHVHHLTIMPLASMALEGSAERSVSGTLRVPIGQDGLGAGAPRPMTSVQLRSRSASSRAERRTNSKGKRARMTTFKTIGYGDRAAYEATAQAVCDA
jgi:hypothetical protein